MKQLEKDFDDGAQPINLRYGVNSAAFRLIPVDKFQDEEYATTLSVDTEKTSIAFAAMRPEIKI